VFAGKYDPADQAPYFGVIGGVAVVLGIVLALAAPFIRRLMPGVR
jgi:POT family proton-dependent oligopeptide transporter